MYLNGQKENNEKRRIMIITIVSYGLQEKN